MKRLGSFFRRNKAVSAHGSRTEENASSGADFTEPPSWVENVPGSGDQEDDPLVVADVQKNVHTDGFGDKSISTFGGFCLLANNITGPAMVNIPVVYQQAGWLPCTIVMVVVMVVSGFSATMMCKAMSMLPGNDRFQGRVEISGLARHYFPKWGYYLTLLLLVISLQATNIASIIISSQTADFAFVAIFKWVCGVEIYPDPGWTVVNEAGDSNSPFGNVVIISIGFVVILLTAIPLGYFNLDDNIYIQVER